ncbi:MAG: hypothetical protein HZB40_07465 [Rhodocyclales bacterium]|nr:hypothetical protein [Rhodocyclales bacterium]
MHRVRYRGLPELPGPVSAWQKSKAPRSEAFGRLEEVSQPPGDRTSARQVKARIGKKFNDGFGFHDTEPVQRGMHEQIDGDRATRFNANLQQVVAVRRKTRPLAKPGFPPWACQIINLYFFNNLELARHKSRDGYTLRMGQIMADCLLHWLDRAPVQRMMPST